MSPVIFLFVLAQYMNTGDCNGRQREVSDYDGPFQPYAQPVHLPLLPQYEIDIPEQEGKLFGGVAATRYETIIVRETVRPVCLFVDGNVPSCDHIHDYNDHPKDGKARRPTNVDYESYFIEPSKPDVKIEITEIPFKGTYVLTGTTDEPEEEHAAAAAGGVHHATPSMVRPVAEDVHERRAAAGGRGRRQMVQNALGAVGTAIAAGLGANAAGLVTNAGGQLLQQGVAAGGGLAAAAVGHGGNRNQVTMHVTRVEKVLDDRVTVTLVPKNCVPAAAQVHALRPCAAAGYHPHAAAGQAYHNILHHHHQQQQQTDGDDDGEEPHRPPADVAADIVSQVDGLVRDIVGSRSTPVPVPGAGALGGHGHRHRVTAAARPFGAGSF